MSRQSAFFEGVTQLDITLAGEEAKLPIFYFDGTAQTALFPARLDAVRRLLPDPRFVPARLAPGLGAVGISCFEYRDTDLGPYNELAISILLNDPRFVSNPPGRALLASQRSNQLHAWVQHLPVTTEIARAGGVELYNYPKFIGSIDFAQDGSRRTCRLGEGEEHILSFDGPLIDTPRSGEVQMFSHLWMDRQPQSSEFKLNVLAGGRSLRPGAAQLELGQRHPIARELAGMLVSRRSFYYELTPRFEGILFGPDHLSLQLIQHAAAMSSSGDPVAG
ncbi:MAG: acetoacetate decarboxylase family protein [Thermoleophilia bacterium]|nr:acetoacetate decarboxylase family protein [Thermoleophilia bacterium]